MNDTDALTFSPNIFEVNCLVKLTSQNFEYQTASGLKQMREICTNIENAARKRTLGGFLWGNWLDMSVLAQEANSSSSC